MRTIGAFIQPSRTWTAQDLRGSVVARIGGAGIHKGDAHIMDVARDWAGCGQRVYIATWANTGNALATKVLPWLEVNCRQVCLAVRSGVIRSRRDFVLSVQTRFGADSVRVAENHAELVVCGSHVLLTSGTTVPSHIFEWFEVVQSAELADTLRSWFEALPVAPPASAGPRQLTILEILRGWNA